MGCVSSSRVTNADTGLVATMKASGYLTRIAFLSLLALLVSCGDDDSDDISLTAAMTSDDSLRLAWDFPDGEGKVNYFYVERDGVRWASIDGVASKGSQKFGSPSANSRHCYRLREKPAPVLGSIPNPASSNEACVFVPCPPDDDCWTDPENLIFSNTDSEPDHPIGSASIWGSAEFLSVSWALIDSGSVNLTDDPGDYQRFTSHQDLTAFVYLCKGRGACDADEEDIDNIYTGNRAHIELFDDTQMIIATTQGNNAKRGHRLSHPLLQGGNYYLAVIGDDTANFNYTLVVIGQGR